MFFDLDMPLTSNKKLGEWFPSSYFKEGFSVCLIALRDLKRVLDLFSSLSDFVEKDKIFELFVWFV